MRRFDDRVSELRVTLLVEFQYLIYMNLNTDNTTVLATCE